MWSAGAAACQMAFNPCIGTSTASPDWPHSKKKKKRRGYVFVPARLKSARQSTTNELIVEGTNNIDNKVARCTLGHYWADRKQQAGGSEARGRGQELTDWLLHCVWKWSYYSSFITMFSAISHYQTTNCLISRIYQYPNHIFFFFYLLRTTDCWFSVTSKSQQGRKSKTG